MCLTRCFYLPYEQPATHCIRFVFIYIYVLIEQYRVYFAEDEIKRRRQRKKKDEENREREKETACFSMNKTGTKILLSNAR